MWLRLELAGYRWHAGEAWSAPLTIQAPIDANDETFAAAEVKAAELIVNPIFMAPMPPVALALAL